MPRRRRRPLLLFALLGSLALHLAFTLPILVPLNLFPVKAPPPEVIPVEIVSLPPQQQKEAPKPPAPQPEPQKAPEPPPKPVVIPPPQPPPPVTPDQIVVATRDVATPPQGDDKPNAAPEKAEPSEKPVPMAPPPPETATPQEKPLPLAPPPPPPEKAESPAKPEPPKPAPVKPEPPPDREITGAIALSKPAAKPRNQQAAPDHKMPPVVVRPTAPGRAGNNLMPSYPSAARANGLQGRVVLLVTLSPDGRPRRIDIARSSGHDQLDESAVRAVWQWRFYRTDSGPPVEATIEIPLDFKL